VTDLGLKSAAKKLLTEKENRRYEKLLSGRRVSYGDWVAAVEAEKKAKAEEAGGEGKFVVILAGEGVLASGACEEIRSYFAAHPEILVLYGDEDVCDGVAEGNPAPAAVRRLPWFKPDWSPDVLDSFFYFGSVVALRRELFQRIKDFYETACAWRESGQGTPDLLQEIRLCGAVGYAVTDFAGYQKWIYNCVALAGGYLRGTRAVGHIRRILFHCASQEEQKKYLQRTSFSENCERALLRDFRDGFLVPAPELERGVAGGEPSAESGSSVVVSVVIPSKDHPEILETCLRGCGLAAGGTEEPEISYEVILVDNGSSAENRRRVEEMVETFSAAGGKITYLYSPQPFHFSRLCNLGAAQAEGKFVLFLNDDVELCLPGCMERLAALADREYTGAVGMKLYYPDSVRIQHVGITNLPMGPVHKLQFLEDEGCYYYGANRGRRNVLAVTAACLMVEREKYLEAGGFAEELPIAFNDVDFCFRLYELGYQNVCVNDLYAYHHESLSRGADEAPEKLDRLLRERDKLYERHPQLEGVDPYYSPDLNREGLDVRIRPAYLTAGNEVQLVGALAPFSLKGYRQDACLMVRVEDFRKRRAVGYGVVLGDNNACYEKMLLLQQQEVGAIGVLESEKEPEQTGSERAGAKANLAECEGIGEPVVYAVKLEGQYRPDLEENMPDQIHVGLCGFLVELREGAVPAGKYRLGMGARNRVTGLKIMNWSNRVWEYGPGKDR